MNGYPRFGWVDIIRFQQLGYFVGYFINSIGSLLERIYNAVQGLPSDNLLILKSNQDWTSCKKVRFYEAPRVIELLKKALKIQMHQIKKCLDVQ